MRSRALKCGSVASLLALSVLAFVPLRDTRAGGAAQDKDAPLPPGKCSVDPPLGWWESKDLGPSFVNPNGPSPTTDCAFHMWAWMAFLHFTMPDKSGQPAFLGFQTIDDLSAKTAIKAGERPLVLKPRTLKPEALGEITQAGPGGIIVDQNGRAVYYSVHMDPGYFAFAKQYYGVANYAKASPTANFPIGATVFKAAWRVAGPNDDPKKVFITTASIAELVNGKDGTAVASGNILPNVKVALVGLHVVSVLKDHPEFAWATFEADSQTPDLPPGVAPNSPMPVSPNGFALYKANTPANACNPLVNNKPVPIKVADVGTQQLTPITNVFLQFRVGGATGGRDTDIDNANKVFRAGVIGHKNVNPIWANYRLIGTVWQPPKSLKPGETGSAMVKSSIGSVDLANSMMETYVQGTGRNCFMCHNTGQGPPTGMPPQPLFPAKNINLSHVLLGPFFGD
jgi:hypothetical protein